MKRAVDVALWAGVTSGLLVLSWLALAPRLFFSSDTGLRYIQIQNLLANQFTSLAVRYAPPGLDDDPLQAPYYWARSIIDGEVYLHISSLFPIAAAAAVGALGTFGLTIVPTLGSVATGCAVAALARQCELRHSRWIGLTSIVATPILFYALVLWDHSSITALAIWGVYGVARGVAEQSPRALLLGGAAIGLATTQRPEFGPFALALGAALLIRSWRAGSGPALWTAAGGVLGALPLWVLQQIWFGHFLGMSVAPHLFGYGDTPEFGIDPIPWLTKVWRFFFYVEPATAQAPWAFGMVAVGMACLAFALSRKRGGDWTGLLAVGFASMLCGYLLLARLGWDHAIIGMAASFPFLPMVLPQGESGPHAASSRASINLVRDTALLFVGFVVLTWPYYGGLQWGSRYLLPAYPLFTLVAVDGFLLRRDALPQSSRKVWVWGSAGLLAAALILQGVGVHRRLAANDALAETRSALEAMSVQLIATDRYFLPSMMASMTLEVVFLDIVGDEEIQALIPKAAAAGVTRMAVVSRPGRAVRLPPTVSGTRVVVTPESDGRTLLELVRE